MAAGFDYLAQAGAQNAVRQAEQRTAEKNAYRDAQAAEIESSLNTPGLSPEDRKEALQKYLSLYQPHEAPTVIARLSGLIHGHKQAAPPPQPAPKDELGVPYSAPSSPDTMHPFSTSHPMLSKIQQGLAALDNHLKGFSQPVKPAPDTSEDTASFVARTAKNPEDINRQDEAQAAAEKERLASLKPKPRDTPQKAAWDAEARKLGYTGYDDPTVTAQDAELIAKSAGAAMRTPVRLKTEHINGFWYETNPVTGERKQIAKDDEVTQTTRQQLIKDEATGKQYFVPVTTIVSKKTGQPIQDSQGNPVETQGAAPGSLASTNADIANANANSKVLNKKKHPVSKNAPQVPGLPPGARVVGTVTTPFDRARVGEYTKLDAQARDVESAYQKAVEASKNPGNKSASDNALVYAYTRAQIARSGRMTQAEIQASQKIGSYGLTAQQMYDKATTGQLPDELRNLLMNEIGLSAKYARQEADQLKGEMGPGTGVPQSKTYPQMPSGSSLADRLNEALK